MIKTGWSLFAGAILGLVASVNAQTVSVSSAASHPILTTLCEFIIHFRLFSPTRSHLQGDICLRYLDIILVWLHSTEAHPTVHLDQCCSGQHPHLYCPSKCSSGCHSYRTQWRGWFRKCWYLPSSMKMILMLNGLICIAVTYGATYTGSFFYRFPASSSFRGSATVSLQSSSGATLGSTTVSLSGAQTSWLQINFSICAGSTPGDLNNHFAITLDGGSAAGQRINFGLLSLFPPTFKNRQNEMRNDIASALAEMGPSFLDVPWWE